MVAECRTNLFRSDICDKMTMDIGTNNSGNSDLKMTSPKIREDATTILPNQAKKQIKRSFDVAFLMLPDEKVKQKHQNNNNNNNNNSANNNNNHNGNSKVEEDIDVISFDDNENENSFARNFMLKNLQNQLYTQHHLHNHHRIVPRVYDDPTLVLPPSATSTTAMLINNHSNNSSDIEIQPRSAFTKVPRIESPTILTGGGSCPPLSVSPDQLSCPSNSPPISLSPPRTPQNNGGGPTLNQTPSIIYNNLRPEYFSGAFQPIPNAATKLLKQQHTHLMGFSQRHNLQQSNSPNSNADLSPNYANTFHHQNGNGHHPFVPQPDLSGIVRSPAAAAILSTLIPPALASTFSLTAQNVCAKCNINFRMTSDLVYHMRSHHKNDMGGDLSARRKREEKLKCPVCNESFRERHHLTRHMTAHQDKDGDDTERISIELNRRQLNAAAAVSSLTASSSHHGQLHHAQQQQQQQQHHHHHHNHHHQQHQASSHHHRS